MKLRTYFLITVFFLTTAVAVLAQAEKTVTLPAESSRVTSSSDKKPMPAPAFNMTSLDGQKFDLPALRGKVVVLNFWFTGCPPCLVEIPKLNALVDKFKNDDVVFIAPTWDDAAVLPNFLKKHPFKYNIVANAGDLIITTYGDGTGDVAMPTHIVIDREGNIDARIAGSLIKADGNTAVLEDFPAAIARLLKGSPDKPHKQGRL